MKSVLEESWNHIGQLYITAQIYSAFDEHCDVAELCCECTCSQHLLMPNLCIMCVVFLKLPWSECVVFLKLPWSKCIVFLKLP